MDKKLSLIDTINVGKNKKIPVSELVNNKGEIFEYPKKGFSFDDEVLQKAGIKKTIRNVKTECVFVTHEKDKQNKKYPKEKESLKTVLKSLHTLDNLNNKYSDLEETFTDKECEYDQINGEYED